MNKLIKSLPVLALLLISVPAFAGSCPKDMKAIDAALADGPSVSASQMARIKELRELGETQHKAGKHADSVATLHEAMNMLGIK